MAKFYIEDEKTTVGELKSYLASLPDDTIIYLTGKNISESIKLEDFKRDIYEDEEGKSLYIALQ